MTKKGDKYKNKPPVHRFLHKYTGYIIMGAGLLVLALYLNEMQVEPDFYHQWTCPMLFNYERGGATFKGVMYDDLSEDEQQRYSEFLKSECLNFDFSNMTK